MKTKREILRLNNDLERIMQIIYEVIEVLDNPAEPLNEADLRAIYNMEELGPQVYALNEAMELLMLHGYGDKTELSLVG